MYKMDMIKTFIIANGGIAKTSELNDLGIKNYEIARLCDSGFIDRLRQGFYKLSNSDIVTEEQMILTFFSEGIICMESALYHYGYNDYTPLKWSLAVPRSLTRSKMKMNNFSYKLYFVQEKLYEIGIIKSDFNGTRLAMYDRERTICDCFKYRSKMDSELFNKALHAYVGDDQKNLMNLVKYAKEMKLTNKVNSLMEVLLNE